MESRTIDASGNLLVRIVYAYSPRFDVATTTTNVSYWPGTAAVEKQAVTTYDESGNFLTEVVMDFNQSGKHVSGHQVFHDPLTGIFRCFDWNAAQQKHLAIDCPESEESHDGPKDTPKLSRDEVQQHLSAARQAAQADEKSRHMTSKQPTTSSATINNREFALVLPAGLTPGERVSGRVVDDPARYDHHPGLLVTRFTLPVPTAPGGGPLTEWTLKLKGSEPQSADGPISFVVPVVAAIEFTLSQTGDSAIAVSGKVPIPKAAAPKSSLPSGFLSPGLCFKRDVCVVTGKLSGDSRKTFAAFDSFPARIVAESSTTAVLDVPLYMNLGSAALLITEGATVQAMPMVVGDLVLEPSHDSVLPGENPSIELHLDAVSELSDDQWRYGVFPPASLERARALSPGFNPAKTVEHERERREKQERLDGLKKKDDKKEESAGMVLVVVSNSTPDIVKLRGSAETGLVFHLTPESFAMGEFKYNIGLDVLKAGIFTLQATAIPFLAPVKAQVFAADAVTPH